MVLSLESFEYYTLWEQSADSGTRVSDVVQPGPLRTAGLKRPLHRSPQHLSTRDASTTGLEPTVPHIDIELSVPVVNFYYYELYV
jgi:hypothetical protein